MARFGFLFIAVWVLLVAPTLCMGGVLFHLCACEVDACGRSAEILPLACGAESGSHGHGGDACRHGDDACGHEESCSTDPCQDLAPTLSTRADLESELATPLWIPTPDFLAGPPARVEEIPLAAALVDRAVDRPLAERFRPLLN